jgi:glycosyltransferase involved in cell wall biosynthesis
LKILGETGINKRYFEKLKARIAENGLEENVRFLGYLPKERNLAEIASSTIGIALYSEDTHYYMYYADPLKIREYAACGLPLIADATTAASLEAKEHDFGFITVGHDDLAGAVKRLWSEDGLYERYSANALNWSRKFDKKTILHGLLSRLKDAR